MNIDALKSHLSFLKLPDYRFRQIVKNYYSGRYSSFSEMTDLPLELRSDLDSKFSLLSVKVLKIEKSKNSQKALLELSDGLKIESVLMDYDDWLTVCLSTQVGCPLKCLFCATGKMGFKRNLTSEEIIDQLIFWKKNSPVNRVVFMGMGEPFLNWENLLQSLKIINQNLKIGARKISISTAGIVDRIYDFANLNTEINLAISLHAPDQSIRQKIMPIAKKYPLDELLKACNYYVKTTRRQLFFEYALIKDLNDSPKSLRQLAAIISSHKLFYLNIIPLNNTGGTLTPSPNLNLFQKDLSRSHVNFSVRRSLGTDISSACGQLATAN